MNQLTATPFDLTVTKSEITETVVTATKAALNLPPVGTLMRATLGNTVIEFELDKMSASGELTDRVFYGNIMGAGHFGFRSITFWTDVPWTFEILTDDEVDAA